MPALPADLEKLVLSYVDWKPLKMKVNNVVMTKTIVKCYWYLREQRPDWSQRLFDGLVRAMNENTHANLNNA